MELKESLTSSTSKGGDSTDFEVEHHQTLSDKLKAFKSSAFDPEAYVSTKCRSISEKVLSLSPRNKALVTLPCGIEEGFCRGNAQNTSREISDLEGQLIALRNHLSNRASIIQGLAEATNLNSLSTPESLSKDEISSFESSAVEPTPIDEWRAHFTESLEVLLAERRVDEALDALDEAEKVANNAPDNAGTDRRPLLTPSALSSLRAAIAEQRRKLGNLLADAACQASISGFELRSVVTALKRLGDGPHAHALLLTSHRRKLQSNTQTLRPSGATHGVAYTAALSHLVFSTIAQGASDSLTIFDDEPAYSSELVTWSVSETEAYARLITRHVLASPAAFGGLRAVAECVQICLGHCSLLEARGLSLSPVLLKHFRPFVDRALTANLKRIEQCTTALAAADDWLLVHSPMGSRSFGTSPLAAAMISQPKLSASAHRFNTMVQELCEDISPLERLRLSHQALEGILQTFNVYINLLINALPGSMETESVEGSGHRIVRIAETEAQQTALLANAVLLADELIPRAAAKLSPSNHQVSRMDDAAAKRSSSDRRIPEQRELKRRLQRLVDQLRDSFCRQHALELIFTEDGAVRLNADMYLSLDQGGEEPEWFPSPIYQELFDKLTRIANIALEMFVGRERFATMLLVRLTETVILWLSEDQTFWEEIKDGPRPLGPLGLQQFYLDMEFVILFASQGRYLSRNLHQVIKNIIAKAIEAVAATNIDPYSVLPEDEWFADVAQIAIKMLMGKANFENVERELPAAIGSPTVASARSATSPISHGSQ
ncbi:hypothetical protein DM860_008193 [Cuscuta australis]|uniref:Exocyst component Exo84 C-terminal domain-containing protein n=1 Tax=Cuscuta australis TaxID=267555 RepID=A0A328D7W9_9ASTE|nr:hypothetical protein DM860_008193 [Cuscuta australis]